LGLLLFVIALVQFPVYGLLLGIAWAKGRPPFLAALMALLLIHATAAWFASERAAKWAAAKKEAGGRMGGNGE
jgi:hypothetical protein